MSDVEARENGENKVIHEVDGIQEYDNQLPNWWLYLLCGSVVFAFGYWFTYHVGRFADLPAAAYEAEMDRAAAEGSKKTGFVMTSESLAALAKDSSTVARGKRVFTQTCVACHRQDGGGIVGPNLTDEFWLHGAKPDQVYKTITEGVPSKGMAAWGPQLGPDRVQAVTAYVISLRDTNVAGGKPAQGEREPLSMR